MAILRTLAERFWEKVQICAHGIECPYCCWEWQAWRNGTQYGYIRVKRDGVWRDIGAHRIAWEILNKQVLPDELYGLHHCDHPPCCNGMHVYPGTAQRNIHDAMERGRFSYGPHLRGADHPSARCTYKEVLAIRALYRQGDTIRGIARRLSKERTLVGRIVYYKTYKNIP